MQIVTLITDFGNKGYRSATLKGALITANPNMQIIDISHEITPFDIDEAAFILKSSYSSFPTGTIHIVNVLHYYDVDNRLVFFQYEGNYFIGPDNGIFSLVFEQLDVSIYTMSANHEDEHYTSTCAEILSGLTQEKQLDEIGVQIDDMKRKLILQPVIAQDEIRGAVIFVDRYGNITVNIKETLFNKIKVDRNFSLYFNRHDHIQTVSDHYMQVDIGSPLCNFNSHGYLEIAVNLQRADQLLGIKRGDVIQIKFEN